MKLPRARSIAVAAVLILATVAAYWGVWRNSFLRVDDPNYVTDQPMVLQGLTTEGVRWAFVTTTASNYHPLTWLAHMLDSQVFGVSSAAHHSVNLFLHVVNALLLLAVLRSMTGAFWPGVVVAAVFALHPLHVESVAWVAERKDLLSTFFALLAIAAYAGYARNSTPARYLLVFVLMSLGLLAKPMVVTLPFVLLLLDLWPLGRSKLWQPAAQDTGADAEPLTLIELFLEKMPLLLLSMISCALTFWAQRAGGAVSTFQQSPPLARALNALASYGQYVHKTVWPTGLAFFYPYSYWFSLTTLLMCGALLAGGTVLAVCALRTRPYIAVGWFWFLGTLVPVIGIVQAGGQSMADRYMYFPMIGLGIVAAWGAADLIARAPALRMAFAPLAIGILAAFAVATQYQTRHWKDSVTVGQRALAVTHNGNYFAYSVIGCGYDERDDLDSAIAAFEEAERAWPGHFTRTLADIRQRREQMRLRQP